MEPFLTLRRSFSALKDKILPIVACEQARSRVLARLRFTRSNRRACSQAIPIEASPSFSVSSSPQEKLTFRSLADEMFIFLATFGEVPTIFQDFDAFIFINNSRHIAEPLDGSRNFKRFSTVPYISTRLMPIHQPNPNRSGVCVLESQVMDKVDFFFIRYAYQVSSKPKTPA